MTPKPPYSDATRVFTCAGCGRVLRVYRIVGRVLDRPYCHFCHEAAKEALRILGPDAILNEGRWRPTR